MADLTVWEDLWNRWYQNKAEREEINAAMVKEKARLRAQGVTPARPAEQTTQPA